MLYTSGTTGRPKGVPRSHRAERAAALAQLVQLELRPGDRTLGVMPLYHTMGMRSLLAASACGGLFCSQPEFRAEAALDAVERERLTSLYLAPTLFHDLVAAQRERPRDVSSVRALAYAGAPMAGVLVERCVEAFAPRGVRQPLRLDRDLHVHDPQRPAREAGLRRPCGAERAHPPRRARRRAPRPTPSSRRARWGRWPARSPATRPSPGYWQRPDADARQIRDGWYFPGDLGQLDADGDLYLVGRIDDMIVSGGENVHPLEIEEWLVRHPAVDEAAVVGEADERLGQRVVAYVVCAGGGDSGRARRSLPRLADARPLQASARLPFRRRAAEERVGQALAPPAAHDRGNSMTEYDGFRLARENDRGVATITLDVPEKLNRVSMGARDELARVFDELGSDDGVRVVVLRGGGDQAFTAGGDVGMFMERDAETLSHLHVNVSAPERCPKPVIAQLHGYCFGVGLELALACDFRVASDDAQLALPELTLGMIPGSGGASRLVKLIGASRAKDVVMRGRRVPAAEAQAWGLLCEVVPRDGLGAAVASLADELAARPALALRTAKRVIGQAQDAPLSVAMELEGLAYGLLRGTHDFAEGVSAFVEKRKPRYEDR